MEKTNSHSLQDYDLEVEDKHSFTPSPNREEGSKQNSYLSESASEYTQPSKFNQVVLIGAMGAGKSCLGRNLANRLNSEFINLDDKIVSKIGHSIPEYFKLYGEPAFRKIEEDLISDYLNKPLKMPRKTRIIALGGGAWQSQKTRKLASMLSLTAWLDLSADILWSRVKRHPERRPMLQVPNPRQRMEEILEKRLPAFQTADVRVRLEDVSISDAVATLNSAINDYWQKNAR